MSNSVIPEEVFGIIPFGDGALLHHSMYPKHEAVGVILGQAVEFLGITRWQLGKLLGTASSQHIYNWCNGTWRPSALFLTRLLYLWHLRMGGFPLVKVQKVDWEKGQVIWRRGQEPKISTGEA